MLKIKVFFVMAFLAAAVSAQVPGVLATANGRNFTSADLSPEVQKEWESRDQSLAATRKQLLSDLVTDIVLDMEAKARGTTPAKLIEEQKRKIADPTEQEISATYEANRQALGNKPISEVRQPIIAFLRRDPEQSLLTNYVDDLAIRYKVAYGKDVNAAEAKPPDVLFTVATRSVTRQEFETKYRFPLYDAKADPIDDAKADLESAILTYLVETEATAAKLDSQAYVAREVTDKMKQFSDEEKADLENALRRRLFAKYKVKFFINTPPPIVQKISIDDDPAIGPASAPVTVVMFADFQCSACSRTEPVLKKVLSEYPGKIHFVMRDFPLETIHENAFSAALAAYAAAQQGKFFEYGDILFTHQDALDAESLKKYAAQIGLNVQQFTLDSNSEKAKAEVRKDMADGAAYGITGTPTIFVNGIKVRRLSAEDFREAIDNALKAPVSARVAGR
jgi:protein-disulfide isomerase